VCQYNFHLQVNEDREINSRILINLAVLLFTIEVVQAAIRPVQDEYVPNEIIIKFRQTIAADLEEQLNVKIPASKLKLSKELDELNASYKLREIKHLFTNFQLKCQQLRAIQRKNKALLNLREKRIMRRIRRAPKDAKVPNLERIYKLRIQLEKGQSLQEIVAAFNSNPDVEYAELNYIVSIDVTPNDPLYLIQWPLNNTGQIYPESGRYNSPPGIIDCDIDAPEAWDISTGGPDTIVAVVDTGVDYRHRDLNDNMWINIGEITGNGIDDDDNGYVDDIYGYDFYNNDSDPCDDHGHGTHCAGTIAAEGDNGLDIVGVCWNTRIMALKFLGSDGNGSTSHAVTAFYYAVANGADVISNSWGGGGYSYAMKDAIDYAHSQGVIMVASAGNDYSKNPKYPAYYEHMISVAATNSNDEKPPFSNYGDWVDIAAPGVDILSLRAGGTSRGTVYDDYTTVLSGTSMACPHVAGACALLLLADPLLTRDVVYDILIETVDPIPPGICIADGRLNLHSAIAAAVSSQGYISLNSDYYACFATVSVFLIDHDLGGQDTHAVSITTTGGDSETLLLTKNVIRTGFFTGNISISEDHVKIEDGTLQVHHGQIITATYEDANDGTGNTATAEDTAVVDCEAPVIFNVLVEKVGTAGTRIEFETNEPTIGQVRCDSACGEPYAFVGEDAVLAMTHTINISGLSRGTSYYFIVDAFDVASNQTTDDNMNICYSFTTAEHEVVHVPGGFPSIQAAINQAWDGDTVIVNDGNYSGSGNRDIDLKGKAITVRSRNGPENCIIDCKGKMEERYRGFYFHCGEDANSVVKGFTITNGYAPGSEGGAIKCIDSSPTIENCIFSRNSAFNYGGGMHNSNSSPKLKNCTFSENLVTSNLYSTGGGMSNHYSNPTLINCTFTGNSGYSYYDTLGGGMYNYYSNPILTNCAFIENSCSLGGGMYNYYSNSTLTNCTFTRNLVHEGGGGMQNFESNVMLTNCTFNGNMSYYYGDGGGIYTGGGDSTLINCVFTGNSATDGYGGGMYCCDYTNVTLSNCTFAGNSAVSGNALVCYSFGQANPSNLWVANCIFWDGLGQIQTNDNSVITITHSNIQDGWAGPGGNNINIEPGFIDAVNPDPNLRDYRLHLDSPCIDVGDNNSVPYDIDGDNNKTELLLWDLDGHYRFADGDCDDTEVVDMGAYEFNYAYMGDLDYNCNVDFDDFAILGLAWMTEPTYAQWNHLCDISNPVDNYIDWHDMAILSANWLTEIH
jgi:subtilisin family serine protease